jgi:DNA (cytosine-5)-methyltransferase 1
MNYLSVCSGIEAASVAWESLGWKPLAFSEIEAFPRAVLEHHYPDTPLHGDFTVLKDQPWIVDADVLVGGTPCQAFSVAGLRNSLDDARGNLSLEFIRLADAIDAAREAQNRDPSVIVWENVPGVLSVKDNAFGCFLAGLAGDVDPYVPPRGKWTNAGVVDGPARQVAWRVLDAQYFGLAQRRRRVFVVASARAGFDPAAVLLEFEGLRRDSPPRREKGQVAPTIPSRSTAGGGLGTDFDCDGGVIQQPVVMAHGQANAEIRTDGGAPSLTCLHEAPIVAHTLKGEGLDASEAGTGRGTPLVPVAYSIMPQNSGRDYKAREVEVAQPIMAGGPVGGNQGGDYIMQPVAVPLQEVGKRTGVSTDDPRAGIGIGQDGDPMFTLQAAGAHPPAVAFHTANSNMKGPIARSDGIFMGVEPHPSQSRHAVLTNMAVRRLTPVECERLQGFPDDYTMIPWKKKPADQCPDGPRYKALGNSMAVPVMRWIGRRIAEALR